MVAQPPRCRRLALLAAMAVCCCGAAAAAAAAASSTAAADDGGGAAGSPPPAPTVNITLTAAEGPVFDGLGGLSAGAGTRLLVDYREPQRGWCVDSQQPGPAGLVIQPLQLFYVLASLTTAPTPIKVEPY